MTVRTAMWMGAAALGLGAAAFGGGCGAPFVPSSTGGSGGAGSSNSGSGGSTVSATSTTTSTSSGSATCILGMDPPCPMGQYCSTMVCGQGTCQPLPAQTQEHTPVCGCDGKTYWNENVAGSHGMSVASMGACKPSIQCSATQQCSGDDAHCNIDASSATLGCDLTKTTGNCVVLPHTCDKGMGAAACPSNGTSSCMSACEAVATNKPYKLGCP